MSSGPKWVLGRNFLKFEVHLSIGRGLYLKACILARIDATDTALSGLISDLMNWLPLNLLLLVVTLQDYIRLSKISRNHSGLLTVTVFRHNLRHLALDVVELQQELILVLLGTR